MNSVSYEATGNPAIPAIIHWSNASTPVWMQQRWETGPYAFYIRRNGCGHCCAAMAAKLHHVDIDPHQEYCLCRDLWGPPMELPDDKGQDHFQSMAGIVKILTKLNISAACYGIKDQGVHHALDHILVSLKEGKLVIFASNPDHFPNNPFSSGYHWVMAVGFMEDGKILIANSSERATPSGVQFVTPDIIERALFYNATVGTDLTWGELERLHEGCGYIVIE